MPRALPPVAVAAVLAALTLAAHAPTAAAVAPLLVPCALRVGRDSAPVGLEWLEAGEQPRFSWQFAADATAARGREQGSYQLQVQHAATAPLWWDSGVVRSNRTLSVAFGGRTLQAESRYRWRVQACDTQGGCAPFSPWSAFATALSPAAWGSGPAGLGSQWIGGQTQLRADFAVATSWHAEIAHASLFCPGAAKKYQGVGG